MAGRALESAVDVLIDRVSSTGVLIVSCDVIGPEERLGERGEVVCCSDKYKRVTINVAIDYESPPRRHIHKCRHFLVKMNVNLK